MEVTVENKGSPTFQALSREAALAAEHVAIGVTALGKCNYAQTAYYSQAFFALSIGFERSAKLAIVVNHAVENKGGVPSGHELKRYGHNLRQLLDIADEIGKRVTQTDTSSACLPRTEIHRAIIDVLNDFASNVTRYYNLDVVTRGEKVQPSDDPVRKWHERVSMPILEKHWHPASKARVERNARTIDDLLGENALAQHHSESGKTLDSIYASSIATGQAEAVAPYTRMYVLQIGRFFSHLMSGLTSAAYTASANDIPYLSEFFALFDNEDSYFKRRRNWSIYKL